MFRPRAYSRGLVIAVVLALAFCSAEGLMAQGIGAVTVSAIGHTYRGPCPAHLQFRGRIVIEKYPLTLNYVWERSDGAKSTTKVLKVPNASTRTMTVVDAWSFGKSGQIADVWVSLRVRSGNADVTSDHATIHVECR